MANAPAVAGIQGVPQNLRKQRELLGYRYYDSMEVGVVGQTEYKFFFETANKPTFRTNMTTQSYIPKDEKFEIRAIGMYLAPTFIDWQTMTGTTTMATLAAAMNVFMLGSWSLHIGDKEYNKGALHEMLSINSEYVHNALGIAPQAAYTLNYFCEQRENPFFKNAGVYGLDTPVTIDGGFPFYVQANWNAAIAKAQGAAAIPLFVYCTLFGRRERRAIG
jgi:hypothetical protein